MNSPDSHRKSGKDVLVGVSSCLLGEPVRYDGGHKLDTSINEGLRNRFTLIPVCPEIEMGLGVPREPLHLVESSTATGVELIAPDSGANRTESMRRYADQKTAQLKELGLSGFIFKQRSPSCGREDVDVYSQAGTPVGFGRGLFAEILIDALPLLPVQDEEGLSDPERREHFIVRVFAFHRLRSLFTPGWCAENLVAFHGAEKRLLSAQSGRSLAELDALVVEAENLDRRTLRQRYEKEFMAALARPAPHIPE
jgi:uncharacterized protein YbbK (DUF523 family)